MDAKYEEMLKGLLVHEENEVSGLKDYSIYGFASRYSTIVEPLAHIRCHAN